MGTKLKFIKNEFLSSLNFLPNNQFEINRQQQASRTIESQSNSIKNQNKEFIPF